MPKKANLAYLDLIHFQSKINIHLNGDAFFVPKLPSIQIFRPLPWFWGHLGPHWILNFKISAHPNVEGMLLESLGKLGEFPLLILKNSNNNINPIKTLIILNNEKGFEMLHMKLYSYLFNKQKLNEIFVHKQRSI